MTANPAKPQALATVAIGTDRRVLVLPATVRAAYNLRPGERLLVEADTGETSSGEVVSGLDDRLSVALAHDLDSRARRATVRRPLRQRQGDAA